MEEATSDICFALENFEKEAAIETYKEALNKEEDLTSDQHMMITEQLLSIKMDYDKIKRVRDLVELDK